MPEVPPFGGSTGFPTGFGVESAPGAPDARLPAPIAGEVVAGHFQVSPHGVAESTGGMPPGALADIFDAPHVFTEEDRVQWQGRLKTLEKRLEARVAFLEYVPKGDAGTQKRVEDTRTVLAAVRKSLDQVSAWLQTPDVSTIMVASVQSLTAYAWGELELSEFEARLNPIVDIKVNASDQAIAKELRSHLIDHGAATDVDLVQVREMLAGARADGGRLEPSSAESVAFRFACITADVNQAELEKRLNPKDHSKDKIAFIGRIPDGGVAAKKSLNETRALVTGARHHQTLGERSAERINGRLAFARLDILIAELEERIHPGQDAKSQGIVGKLRKHMANQGAVTEAILTRAAPFIEAHRATGALDRNTRDRIESAMDYARLDVMVAQNQKRLERKREGWENKVSVALFDATTDAGKEAVKFTTEARDRLSKHQDNAALGEASARDIETLAQKAHVCANAFDKRRADLTEYIAANGAYVGARAWMTKYFASWTDKDKLRWDAAVNPKTGRLNWSGLLKEFIVYEIPNVAVRLLTMGKDFNPFDPETYKALWGEVSGAAIATSGTLATSMFLRKHTIMGRMGDFGRVLSCTLGCAVFSTIAGYVSYAAIPEDARGSDLTYASFRATKNGVVRYALLDGLGLLFKPFGGFSHVWAKFSASMGFDSARAAVKGADDGFIDVPDMMVPGMV